MKRMLQSIFAWTIATLFLASVLFWVRSYLANDQLQYVLVRSLPSPTQDIDSADHIRLGSSWGRFSIALMRSRTLHPINDPQKVAPPARPSITRLTWDHEPDDINELRKKSKKWERRGVFEFGRITSKTKANPQKGILAAASRSAYLVIPWPEICLILGLLTWPLVRLELAKRRRPWLLVHGYCMNCGYDMRKRIGPCPECGRSPWGLAPVRF